MAPAVGAAIFRTGPLAWDGVVSFWLRNGAFALFVVVMFFVLRAALHRQAVEEGVARSEQRDVTPTTGAEPGSTDGRRPPRAGKRDVWIVFWIVPAFYTAFGVIFFALARVMPPPRPDVTTDQMVHFFTRTATTIQIGFGILILIVGGAGDGQRHRHVPHEAHDRRVRCWRTRTWVRWRSARFRAACWWRSAS